ncbi:stomatin [Nanobdella aerobiophila]|uniref:Stomatin n=1 Tax=Nanobdella aerobiophila TaxID=2586965 RepID=A0A915WSQ4_9ARCH|nr:SPFH domain-containing protein [Nanobdella aerobiophila]BBL45565.1 stomatin [Nanobdella aerobiophila]
MEYSNGKQWLIFFIFIIISVLIAKFFGIFGIIIASIIILYTLLGIRIVYNYERAVLFTLGYYSGVLKGGLIYVLPGFQRIFKVDIRLINYDLPEQILLTADNINVSVKSTIFYRIIDPGKVIMNIRDIQRSILNYAQTNMRDIFGKYNLNDILQKREEISTELRSIIQEETKDWGIIIDNIKIQDIEIPSEILSALTQKAIAERQRDAEILRAQGEAQAKVIQAQGELQASKDFMQAAKILEDAKYGIALRFLDILRNSNNEKIIVVPPDIFDLFNKIQKK